MYPMSEDMKPIASEVENNVEQPVVTNPEAAAAPVEEESAEVEAPAKQATLEELIRAHRAAAKAPAEKPAEVHAKRPVGRRAVVHKPE